jgi:hypothetical protein
MRLLNRARLPALVTMAVLTTLSCEQVVVTTAAPDQIAVSPQVSSVRVTQSAQLNVAVTREGRAITGRTVSWTSLNPGIASVDAGGMVRGVAPGVATIQAAIDGVEGSATVTVTSGPAIEATPDTVDFTAIQNGASPGDRSVNVSNAGDGALTGMSATVRYSPAQPTGWLDATLPATAPATMVLSADQGGLTPGIYTAFVDIASAAADNSPVTVTVRLTVQAIPAAIALSSATTSFGAAQGGADPAAQTVGVTNAGGSTLSGLTTAITYTQGQPTGWLTATLSATTAPATLTLRAALGSLPQGVHTAQVQVRSAVAQNSPQTVSVTFTVGPALPAIALNPATLTGLAVSVEYPGGTQPAG